MKPVSQARHERCVLDDSQAMISRQILRLRRATQILFVLLRRTRYDQIGVSELGTVNSQHVLQHELPRIAPLSRNCAAQCQSRSRPSIFESRYSSISRKEAAWIGTKRMPTDPARQKSVAIVREHLLVLRRFLQSPPMLRRSAIQ